MTALKIKRSIKGSMQEVKMKVRRMHMPPWQRLSVHSTLG